MPELPEVETVRTFLKKHVNQRKILSIKIENSNLRFQIPKDISSKLSNIKITKIIRRGKYLIIFYANDKSLLIHLGMTGYFRISEFYEKRKHDHLIFYFSDKVLIFNDIRKFGFVKLFLRSEILNSSHLKNLGPEPLSADFSAKYFSGQLCRKTNIKNLLMNQNFVAGLGNIYCSEILFHAKVNPCRKVESLEDKEVRAILISVRKILTLAIRLGGTTIKNFVVSDEEIGYFKNNLSVYGRENMDCKRCKNKQKIKKIIQSGRSTFFCVRCQI